MVGSPLHSCLVARNQSRGATMPATISPLAPVVESCAPDAKTMPSSRAMPFTKSAMTPGHFASASSWVLAS